MVNDQEKYFVFNGKKSSDFGVWASELGLLESPAKRVEVIEVAGRNGDIIIEDGSYENVKLKFKDCFMIEDFSKNFNRLKAFLYKQKGYQRLETPWLPDEYRLAAFEGDIDPTVRVWEGFGKFDLTFNCKPQRFLKSGEEPITIIPPYILSGTVRTPTFTCDIDVDNTTITVVKFPANHSGIALTWQYEQEGGASSTYSLGTATGEGWSCTFPYSLPLDSIWRIEASIGDNDSFDDFIFAIDGTFLINDKRVKVNALCGRSIELYNPTGFETSPYIECDGAILGVQSIRNYDADGNMTEAWELTATDYSEQTTSAIIDCENEYLYYVDANGKKQNITGHITLEHVDGAWDDLPLTFPKLGGEKTLFYSYITYAYQDLFIRIYPRWYTI